MQGKGEDAIHQEVQESRDLFFHIMEPDDLEKAGDDERIGIMLGLKGRL